MRRYLALPLELLALSWRRVPLLTAGMFGTLALSVVAVPATGLALRAAVNGSVHTSAGVAVVGALTAAASYGITSVIVGVHTNLRVLLVEKVGLTDVHERIHLDIAGIEGIEHLENPDFLDRVTVVRGAAWGIMAAAWGVVDVVFVVLQLLVSLVLLGALSPWLLVLLGFAAVPLWFQRRGAGAVKRVEVSTAEAFRLQQQLFDLATSAADSKEIRVAGAGEALARLQRAAWDEALGARTRVRLMNALWRLGGWLVFAAGFLAALALIIYRQQHARGSLGDVVLAIAVASNLRFAVGAAVARTTDAAGAGRLVEPLLWLRRYAQRDRARGRGGPAPERLRDGIRLERVSYSYPGTGRPALDDVSVHIPAGRVVAVVGEYGSGKTTLVKLLTKLYRPDSGAIRVDGTDLATVDAAAWRAGNSGAFQDFGRYHTTFREAVGIGDPPNVEDRARVERAVAAADATALLAALPHGVDTQLGREFDGVDLSEGQWQKLALARASMRDAPLLFVLDEPTASLDAPSENAIFEWYMGRAAELAERKGTITLIVSHRFSTVRGADLILVLHGGRLVESGTHEELLARNGRYAELYGVQEAAYSPAPAPAPAPEPAG